MGPHSPRNPAYDLRSSPGAFVLRPTTPSANGRIPARIEALRSVRVRRHREACSYTPTSKIAERDPAGRPSDRRVRRSSGGSGVDLLDEVDDVEHRQVQ